jgi:16S rRNA processing protein RimM
MSDRICVAAITGSYGVRGEARVKSFCAEPSALGDYGPLSDDTGTRDFKVTITRPVKGGFAVRLSGVKTKEEADALKGTRLYAPRDVLPALPDDEFYHADLMGLSVVDTGGADLGQVHAVMNHGAGDLLEVRQKGRSGTVLVPFTQAIVPTVDLAAGRIVVDPPEGLFDED